MKKLRMLVVNGFSSGMMIVDEAKRMGWECFHLSTPMEGVPESYIRRNMASGYDGILERKDDFEEQVRLCMEYGFDIVMPGSEGGVLLADQLADALSLPCNDIRLSLERRDKYYMQKRLEDLGIPCIQSRLVRSAAEAVEWYRSNRMSVVVMKPRMDAGGLGFHLCESEDEIRTAFNELYGQKSCFGEDVETPDVLMQEYICGKEIVINHVSHGGAHEITDLWVYDKEGAIYNYARLVDVLTEEYSEAVRYTKKVLDALGIQYGPSHTEIMLTERGPLLVETGARLMGFLPAREYSLKIFGYSIVEKAIRSYVCQVKPSVPIREGFRFSDYIYYVVNMRSNVEGRITGLPVEEILSKCRYVVKISLEELKESMALVRTEDLGGSPGSFALLGADGAKLQEWLKLYTMIEKEHPHILYHFENDVPLSKEELKLKRQLMEM